MRNADGWEARLSGSGSRTEQLSDAGSPEAEAPGSDTGSASFLMPVAERFVSVNGEGQHAGRLAAFIRFAGCNLRCSYCDTAWAIDPAAHAEQVSVEDLVRWASTTPAACVTLTGGEPVLQPALPQLVRGLLSLESLKSEGGKTACPRVVEIETNGSVSLRTLAEVRNEFRGKSAGKGCACNTLSFTMDWKLPGSGMEPSMRADNIDLLDADDTVKFVVGSTEDLEEMLRVVRSFDLCDRAAVYVSPVFGRIEPAQIVDFLKDHGLARIVLQLQLHKIIWPAAERGV